ncbi:putative Cache sensor signal transduction histidine kinase [Desulfamplus magnetovallimortis]|uniref:histidine kinase n=1 Tax=Desulfamplus magnetovallimortis TaxID=1246637 RepID=A0A1W1H5E8_9BACT|nr:ATP-binding protein [Desulfamplus magnetovallimortis]SLM27588.1 putative Cache sensor signal transduction histidine kinase [Desulfamplus magnetovallimortis]
MQKSKLNKLILNHYSKSALIPILIIEIMLLFIYFAVNSYTNHKTRQSLEQEVQTVMPHLVRQQASQISDNFENIAAETNYFATEHALLLAHPELYFVPGEQPRFETAPNNTLYQTNLTEGSSLFYTRADNLTPQQIEKAIKTAALNPLYIHMVKDIPNVAAAYLNTPDDMNRLYPFIDKVYEQYPSDLNMEDYNFYYLADREHNPDRKPVWTGVYLDPAGNGWMLSCVAPVYVNESLEGVVGLDVTTSDIITNVLKLDLPWEASAFVTDDKGMILAMQPRVEELLGLKELKSHVYSSAISKEQQKPEDFNLFKSKDNAISETFREIFSSQENIHAVTIGSMPVFLIQSRIAETGWRLFIQVDQETVYSSAKKNADIARYIGYGVVAVMVIFYLVFFFILRKNAGIMANTIAKPIINLADATSHIGHEMEKESSPTALTHSGISEIDLLTDNFNAMTMELEDRNRKLVEHQVKIKMQEKEAELAYAQGMFEAASGYLHNVGNSVTALNSTLMDLDEIVKSTEQYPKVFKRLREESDPAILDRFENVLVEKTVPKLSEGIQKIFRIRETIQQTISHQQQSFKDSRQAPISVRFNISELLEEMVLEFKEKYPDIKFETQIAHNVFIKTHKIQMLNGLNNIIKNAVEAINDSGNVNVNLTELNGQVSISVMDDGCGIAPENISNVLNAGFTTKANGNGFGLHSFSIFLSANKNRLKIKSDGINLGTTVSIEIEGTTDHSG